MAERRKSPDDSARRLQPHYYGFQHLARSNTGVGCFCPWTRGGKRIVYVASQSELAGRNTDAANNNICS